MQQKELFDYRRAEYRTHRFCPGLAKPARARPDGERWRPWRTRHQRHCKKAQYPPGAVCLKWAVRRGQSAFFNARIYLNNLLCTTEDPLADEEMEAISGIDPNFC